MYVLDYFFLNFYIDKPAIKSEAWSKQLLVEHLLFKKCFNVFWTIPVEMQFYFLLPIVVLIFQFLSRKKITFVGLSIFIAFWLLSIFLFNFTNNPLQTLFIHQYVPCFIIGIYTSLLLVKTSQYQMIRQNKVIFEIVALISALILILQIPSLWSYIFGAKFDVNTFDMDAYYKPRIISEGILVSIFTLCYLNGKGIIKRFLENKFLVFTGKISFSLYLIHYQIIHQVKTFIHLPKALETLIVFIFAYLISMMTFLLIEKPFINLFKTKGEINNANNLYQTNLTK